MSSERMDQSGKSSGRPGRHSGDRGAAGASQDPDRIAAEIERTREDLAETLDQIADRVSPKRVAERGRQRLSETVREKTALAKEKAAAAQVVAKEKAATVQAVAREKAATAQAVVQEKAATAQAAVQDKVGQGSGGGPSSGASSVRLDTAGGATAGAPGDLPPVRGVEVPRLAPDRPAAATAPLSTSSTAASGPGTSSGPTGGTSTWSTTNPLLTPEALAGVALALIGLWLLRRRR